MERSLVVAAALALSACTTVEYVPVEKPKQTLYSSHDAAAIALLKCDALVTRETDAHRLCMMREIDRLKVTATQFTNLPKAAPISILPYAYPPLAPANSVFVR